MEIEVESEILEEKNKSTLGYSRLLSATTAIGYYSAIWSVLSQVTIKQTKCI
jgi:hypothetical protein